MKIKVSIPLISDSFNTYPQDDLEFLINDESVKISLYNDGAIRVIEVSKKELEKLLMVIGK